MFYLPPSCVFTGLCGFPPFRRAVVILNALAVVVGRSPTFSIQASFETGNAPERVPIRSRNGAATPAGGPVETSWTPVSRLWNLWGRLGPLRRSFGDIRSGFGTPPGAGSYAVARCRSAREPGTPCTFIWPLAPSRLAMVPCSLLEVRGLLARDSLVVV